MANKEVYKIPTDLGISYLDQEIGLLDTAQARPVQLRVLLAWVGSVLLLVWLLTQTPIKEAAWWVLAAFVVWWVGATVFYLRTDSTRRLRLLGLADLAGYLPRSARFVQTRSASPAAGLRGIVGVHEVVTANRPGDPALLRLRDGRVGYAYQVVGSASALLFDADRRAILDRVDAFYRKLDTNSELVFATLKRAQRVESQLASIAAQRQQHRNPQLLALLDERAAILDREVGGAYLSIQQYLVVAATNAEALARTHALVVAEAQESPLMLRLVEPLDRTQGLGLLAALYAGR